MLVNIQALSSLTHLKGSSSDKRFTGLWLLQIPQTWPLSHPDWCLDPTQAAIVTWNHMGLPIPLSPARSEGHTQPISKPDPQTHFHFLPLTISGKASSHLHMGSEHRNPSRKGVHNKNQFGDTHQLLLKPEQETGFCPGWISASLPLKIMGVCV